MQVEVYKGYYQDLFGILAQNSFEEPANFST